MLAIEDLGLRNRFGHGVLGPAGRSEGEFADRRPRFEFGEGLGPVGEVVHGRRTGWVDTSRDQPVEFVQNGREELRRLLDRGAGRSPARDA